MAKILVTGCAGFIGSSLTDRLLAKGHKVIGIDNFNDYYNPSIKESNLKNALTSASFKLYRKDILDFKALKKIFEKERPQKIVHLAARAGVRPSIDDPLLYAKVNVVGTVNLLKLSVEYKVEKFIFGSSSSVYGNSPLVPFSENDLCRDIISPYGASKRSAEFFVESFSKNFNLKSVILRFFTVYGPRGRVDMAPSIFTKAILEGRAVKQFGDGSSSRDYTYIDDIVDGIIKVFDRELNFEIINLGNNKPVKLVNFIKMIEKQVGKNAIVKKVESQPGDVLRTWANIDKAKKELSWSPKINIAEGLKKYFQWLGK